VAIRPRAGRRLVRGPGNRAVRRKGDANPEVARHERVGPAETAEGRVFRRPPSDPLRRVEGDDDLGRVQRVERLGRPPTGPFVGREGEQASRLRAARSVRAEAVAPEPQDLGGGGDAGNLNPVDLEVRCGRIDQTLLDGVRRPDGNLLAEDRVEECLEHARVPRQAEPPEPPFGPGENGLPPDLVVEPFDRVVEGKERSDGGSRFGRPGAVAGRAPSGTHVLDREDPRPVGATPHPEHAGAVRGEDERPAGVLELLPLLGERAQLRRLDLDDGGRVAGGPSGTAGSGDADGMSHRPPPNGQRHD
jgi:hypothetical protein